MDAARVPYLLHHLLADAADRFPSRPAVRDGSRTLTYAELDDRSARLAAVLRQAGLEPGGRVGLHLPKSLEAVVGIFGALRAGGVYVPIDPHAPARRSALIVRDCALRHLVTTTERLEALHGAGVPTDVRAVLVDGEAAPPWHTALPWSAVEAAEPLRRSPARVETDLAYILYTSGSTGAPKGVMIPHRAALTFVNWTRTEFGITNADVVSSHAPLHFDLSILDIFTTVSAGAAVVLVPDRLSTFPIRLVQLIRDEAISVWYSVPSALVLMLTRGRLAETPLPSLRLVLFAGEVFPIRYLRALRGATSARLFNLYGPTETNVCTFHEVTAVPPDDAGAVPIGRAIANYDVFAVGVDGRPVEPGETGELYARGPGLMAGYWGDPDKTAHVLVPHPFGSPCREPVCRTGDLVTLQTDGTFMYVGRRDHMVKVRGNRVELGEIEAALYACARVREACVVPVPANGTLELRACVVVDPEAEGEAKALQAFLQDRLPPYMVPRDYVFYDRLPKTSTGKVDRQTLAGPARVDGA